MKALNIHEAKARFSELVQRASEGEEIVIARNDRPMARILPLDRAPRRAPGGWEGRVWIAPDQEQVDAELAALLAADEPER